MVIVLRLPFSVTDTRSFDMASNTVARFLRERGRPLGLPEIPGLKRVCFGGRPWPTSYSFLPSMYAVSAPVRSGHIHPLLFGVCLELRERFAAPRVHGATAAVRLPAANNGVDIQGIDLQSVATPASALGCDHG